MRTGVLASGSGSILAALVEAEVPIELVCSDRACPALEIAHKAGVATELVERGDFTAGFDRAAYSERLAGTLSEHGIDLVVMAGFGTVVGAAMHEAFPGRILNTHPALLPAFKGWHAVRDALAAGVKVTGCTVHVATLEVDDGPILAEEAVPVLDDDTEEALHERIKAVERRLYPATVKEVLARLEKGEAIA